MKKLILLLSLCALLQACGKNSALKENTNYFPNALIGTDDIHLYSEQMFNTEDQAKIYLINHLDKSRIGSFEFTEIENNDKYHFIYLCGMKPKNKEIHRSIKMFQSALEMVYHDELMNPLSSKKFAVNGWEPDQRILVTEIYKFIGLLLKKKAPEWEQNPDAYCNAEPVEYKRTKTEIKNGKAAEKFDALDAEKELLEFSQNQRNLRVSQSEENLLSLDVCPLSGPKNQEVKNQIPRLKKSLDILYPEKQDSMMHFALKESDKLIPADNNACVKKTVTVARKCHDEICEFVVQ